MATMYPENRIPGEKEVLSKAVKNIAFRLNLSQKELSEILGTSRSEISRVFANTAYISPATKIGECALLLIRVYRDLGSLLGDDPSLHQEWFKNYNEHLHGYPIELSKTITGLVSVVSYLDTMRGYA